MGVRGSERGLKAREPFITLYPKRSSGQSNLDAFLEEYSLAVPSYGGANIQTNKKEKRSLAAILKGFCTYTTRY
uniref:Uncharacterized protein n=1 Tax=Timema monikensis TaxID=170555 RepID=A0A7R9HS37_9NEOP|nr:unnamed protein product [Timema monikensis]